MYQLKIFSRHTTLTIQSLSECRQSIAASIQKLPYSTVKSVTQLAMNRVDSSGETIC